MTLANFQAPLQVRGKSHLQQPHLRGTFGLIWRMRNQNRSRAKEIWVCEFTFLEMKKNLIEAE